MAVDAAGNVYVADTFNNRIRIVTPSGATSTLAGSGTGMFANGVGTATDFAVRCVFLTTRLTLLGKITRTHASLKLAPPRRAHLAWL